MLDFPPASCIPEKDAGEPAHYFAKMANKFLKSLSQGMGSARLKYFNSLHLFLLKRIVLLSARGKAVEMPS